ncbi:MAG TPA: carbamate kinase [Segeticoccus sp.]|nr:carbamate kinase [Segeticoccus sp.]
MRIVVALGGNALLRRGQVPDADAQLRNIVTAVRALAPLEAEHELVLTHGNGPQVGVLAMESAADPRLTAPYPFDALGALTQGLIGYWLLQSLQNALPHHRVASIINQTLVDRDDPAFGDPRKFVGEVFDEQEARRLADSNGWQVRPDDGGWRRVVASPRPLEVVESELVADLLDAGTVVVCAGGGGVPVVRDPATGDLHGVEAVVDKDLTAALLAERVGAELLLVLTDVPAVVRGYGTDATEPIRRATPQELRAEDFAAGSMGPKVDAVCRFVERTGKVAAIGRLSDAADVVVGSAGTVVRR